MRVLGWVVFAAILGAAAAGGVVLWAGAYAEIEPIAPPARSAFDAAEVARGEKLAGIGDCAVCHSKPGGEPLAGGRALETPFGVIFSTNITPDPQTGIGRWSEAAFRRALHEGVDREGGLLYPAFPYDHFAKVTAEDVRAIYAFLMTSRAVRATAPENELGFPFNIRRLIAAWNLLFLERGELKPDSTKTPDWNRGAYLVEGLGHCGSCHTPRNALGAERRGLALAGGEAEGWHAPALNAANPAPAPWTEDTLTNYLIDGWDRQHGIAAGPMVAVVNQLADQPEEEARAIAVYLASFLPPPGTRATQARAFATEREWKSAEPPPLPAPGAELERGRATYARACANCHAVGKPPALLALTGTIASPDPTNLIRVILDGVAPPKGTPDRSMPRFATLSDAELSDLVLYIQAQFVQTPRWSAVPATVSRLRRPKG